MNDETTTLYAVRPTLTAAETRIASFVSHAVLTLLLLSPAAGHAALDQRSSAAGYESALQFFEKGRSIVAIKQLKAVLDANPGDLPARILLGKVYLSLGYAAAAEVQLREALRSGANLGNVVVPLAQSVYEQRRFEAMLEEFHAVGHRPKIQAELLVLRGLARLSTRELDAAEKAFAEALRIAPTEAAPFIGRAQLNLSKGQLDRAEADISTATDLDPRSSEAWYVLGIVATYQGDRDKAHAALGRAIELVPQNMPARSARAFIDIQRGNFDAARSDVEFVLSNTPNDAQAQYLHARILQRDGDIAGARAALGSASATIIALPPEVLRSDAQLLLLAGHISIALEKFEEAYGHMRTFVSRFPHHLAGRQVLARLQIKRGELRDAFEVLEPVFAQDTTSPKLQELKATLLIGLARHSEALPVLEGLHHERPDDVPLMMKYARALMQAGRQAEGLRLLERALALQPENTVAAMTLGTSAIAGKDLDQALEMAERVVRHKPEAPTGYNLKGAALMAQGDMPAARAAFERGLSVSPGHVPTSHNLARLHLRQGDTAAAIRVYQAALEVNTGSVSTMLELASILEQAGDAATAVETLERARSLSGSNLGPAMALFELHLRMDNIQAADNLIAELEANYRENLTILEARGRIETLNGESFKARTTFETMSRIAGFNAPVLRRIARFQQGVKDFEGARYSLQKALQGNQNDLTARVELVRLELGRGQVAAARRNLSELTKRIPQSPSVAALEGEVLMAEGRFEEAAKAFAESAKRQGRMTSPLLIRQFRALKRAGLNESARSLMDGWLQLKPRDIRARLVDASARLREGDVAGAQAGFEGILTYDPNHILAMNNLASILRDREPARALEIANRAYELAPEFPPVLDTLGWVLAQHKEYERALSLLRSAEARAGGQPEILYHLAVVLDGVGRREAALKALRGAVGSSQDFNGREDAQALLATWQSNS